MVLGEIGQVNLPLRNIVFTEGILGLGVIHCFYRRRSDTDSRRLLGMKEVPNLFNLGIEVNVLRRKCGGGWNTAGP
jgi:hypothetical protein